MNAQTKSRIVDLKELGVSFKIPAGWSSQIDGDYMYLRHEDIPGLMVIFESRSSSTEDLISLANEGIRQENLELHSMNDFETTSKNTVVGHYKGYFMGSMVTALAIGKIDGRGSGLSLLALSDARKPEDRLKIEAQNLMASVNFTKAEESKQTRFWKKRLVGKRLKYFNTLTDPDFRGGISTSISDKETLDLFNDGSFYYYVNNQSIISSSTLQNGNRSSGDYRIMTLGRTTYLQLFYGSETLEFELTVNDKNNTLLNARRYLIDNIGD